MVVDEEQNKKSSTQLKAQKEPKLHGRPFPYDTRNTTQAHVRLSLVQIWKSRILLFFVCLNFCIVFSNFLGVRNPKEAQKNVEAIVDTSKIAGSVVYERLDTGSLNSVRQFAAIVNKNYSKIDILINNAGVMATPFHLTEDGFESQFAINYLGHFLLTHLLMPALRAAGTKELRSRIVNVSSCVHLLGTINFDDINGTYVWIYIYIAILGMHSHTNNDNNSINGFSGNIIIHLTHTIKVNWPRYCSQDICNK